MHSRGPTEQHFYVWEPHRGCLHKVKKVGSYPLIKKDQRSHNIGKWSRTPNYYTTSPVLLGSVIFVPIAPDSWWFGGHCKPSIFFLKEHFITTFTGIFYKKLKVTKILLNI